MATDVTSLQVRIDTTQVAQATNRMNALSSSANTTSNTFNNLRNTAVGVGVAMAGMSLYKMTKEFLKVADAVSNMDTKLKLSVKTIQEYKTAQEELYKIAQDTRTDLSSTVDLYSRIARSTRDLAIEQKKHLELTNTINQAMILSGGTAESLNSAVIQLGQAFSSDFKAVGQELGSIREQAPRLYQALVDGSGMASDSFKKAAEDGKLSSKIIIQAIESQAKTLNREYGSVSLTLEQSKTAFSNATTSIIGNIDKSIQLSSTLAESLYEFSKNMGNSKDEIVDFAVTATAHLKNFGALVNAIYETTSNTSIMIVNSINMLVYGAVAPISDLFLSVVEGMNSIGVASDDALKNAKGLSEWANKSRENAKNNIVSSLEEIGAAWKETGTSVEDRIALMKAEAKLIEDTTALELKRNAVAAAKEKADRSVKGSLISEELSTAKMFKYYETIGDYQSAWLQKEKDISKDYKGLKEDELKNLIEIQKKEYFDKIAEEQLGKLEATENVTATSLTSWQNYYSTIGDYQAAWALKEAEINEEYKDLTKEQLAELVAIQKKEYFDKISELKSDEEIVEIDKNLDSYEEMLSYQLELIDATDMWNNSLDGVSKTIGNVMGAMNTLAEVDIKSKKKQAGTDADLAKAKAEFGEDSIEYYEAENEHINETSKNKVAAQEAEYAGYSALAGAMASAYEQGSAGAILFTAAQSALGIASSWTAISAAWALGFPQNIPAVAMVTSAVMPIISQLGGGGGGGGSSAPSVMEVRQEEIDAHYEPILDKFDAQIELLESIDKNGSAAKLEIDKAKTQYEFDFDTLINEAINNFGAEQGVQGSYSREFETQEGWNNLADRLDRINEAFGQDIWIDAGSKMLLNANMISDNESFLKYLGVLAEENVIVMANWASMRVSAEQNLLNAEAKIFEVQEIMADFAVSSYESFSELNDAREDIGEMFDTITDSATFANMKIEESFKNVNQIVGEDETLENFLLKNIGIISDLKESFTDAELETLFSTQPEDFLTQQETLYKLNEKLGTAYKLNDESLKKLINSMDDFDIVAEALETSRGNIKDFTDSFKTDFQLAEDMAAKLGVEVATTFEEMNQQFIDMSSDIEGLTDTEADFLDITYDLTQSFKDAGDEMRSFITDYDLAMSLIGVEGTEATQLNLDSVNTKIDELINSSIMTGVTQLGDVKTIAVLNKDKDTLLNELLTAQVNSVGSTSEKGSVWEADRENFISFWEGLNKDTTLLGYQNAALDNVGLNIDFDDISNSSIEQLKYWITTAAVEGYRETYGESGESAISEMEKAFAAISTTYQTESVVGGGVVENYDTVLAGATKENITDIIETILNKFGAESEAYTAAQNLADLFIEQAQLQYTIDNPTDTSSGTDTSTDDINNNIKIWLDSFKTATELATDLGVEVGKGLSTSMEDLSLVFDELKVGDLSDIELEFLQTNKAIIDTTKSLQDEYDLLLLTGDDVAYLAKQREFELEEISDSNKAIQESIWLEEDRQKALEESNAILETYIENLANEKVAIIEQFEDIKDGISDTLKDLSGVKIKWDDILSLSQSVTTPEEAETLKSMIDTYYTQQTDLLSTQDSMLEDQKQDEIDSLNTRLEVLNAEKDILDSFKDFATTLRTTQLEESGDTEALLNLFGDSFSKLNTALLAGEDGSDLATESMDYASSYLAALKESGTNREYEYEVSRLANQFEGYIGTGKEATISDLETELETLNKTQEAVYDLTYLQEKTIDGLDIKTASMLNTLDNKIDSNITRTNMELVNLQDTAIEYLGADSDIVYWLNAINDSTIDLNTSLSEWQTDRDVGAATTTYSSGGTTYSSRSEAQANADNINAKNAENLAAFNQTMSVTAESLGVKFAGGSPLPPVFVSSSYYTPFADGGLVKGGMGGTLGLIGEKGYDELVVPLDNRDALGMNNFSKKLAKLNGIISNQNSLIMKQNNILTESRDLQNSSYVALKTIEELQ